MRFSTANGSLPASLATLIQQEHTARTAQLQERGISQPSDERPVTGASVTLRFAASPAATLMIQDPGRLSGQSLPTGSALSLQVELRTFLGAPPNQAVNTLRWQSGALGGSAPPEPARPRPAVDDPELKREVELALPPAPPWAPGPLIFRTARWRPGMIAVGPVLEALQKATGLEILADHFTPARLLRSSLAGKHQVEEILALIEEQAGVDWRKEQGILQFRNRRYFEHRPAEVPERILLPWRTRVAPRRLPSVDELAELGAVLSDRQAQGLEEYWGWYLEDPEIAAPVSGGVYTFRLHLRFWASLPPAERQALRAGAVLPVSQMTPVQQQAFAEALASPVEPMGGLPLPRQPTPAEVADGAFHLRILEFAAGGASGAGPSPAAPSTLRHYAFTYHLPGEDAGRPFRISSIRFQVPPPRQQ